jgi:beta-N-acetylhexosaminidase
LSLNELERDSSPFRNIAGSDISPAIWGMSAHVIYEAIDPGYPASISLTVIREVIRGEIGFDGLLLCDDLEMKALDGYGDISQKAMLALEAGNDAVLHCNGKIEEMEALAENLPRLSEDSVERLNESCLSGNTGS